MIGGVISSVLTFLYVRLTVTPAHGAFDILIMPGVVGYLLIGGVHGGASERALELAQSISNGFFWGFAAWCAATLIANRPRGGGTHIG